MTSFSIRNFGCRVNQAEAFDWAAELEGRGFRLEAEGRGAVVLVNTCTLTSRADRDARKFIRRTLRENPEAKVVVTGCLAERDPDGLRAIAGVWKVVPNAEKEGILEAVVAGALSRAPHDQEESLTKCSLERRQSGRAFRPLVGREPIPRVLVQECPPEPPTPRASWPSPRFLAAGESFRARALVKVQDGCDMACRFCIIPQVRGRSRSVIPDEILSRVRRLTEGGFGEVVLTGIHLSSYGRDLRPRSSLRELVRAMDGLDGDFRVRLSSLDPRLMPPSLLDVLTRSRRTSPHFHLSLQHGADRILRAMGRESTAAEYRSLLAALSDRASEAAIGADIIVGFPGETEDDFEATATLVRDAPLSYVHVFSFSPRPGTPAALLGQVDEATKKRRAARLRVISKQKSLQFRRRFLGRILEGIVVRSSTAGGRVLTANYVDLVVPPRRTRVGAAVRVRINAVNGGETAGEIVSDE